MASLGEAFSPDGDLDRAAAGADLAELYTRYGPAVRGLCRALLRNGHEAEDAAQQVFLSAHRSLLGGTVPRHPAAWLATIARNECVARIQRRMREPLATVTDETLPDPVATAAERADLSELWQAIADLPRKQREAFLLREFSGLSYSELAATLAVSEPAVESLLVRARSALRHRLQPAYGSVAGVAPVAALRNLLARLAGGTPDPTAARGLWRLAAAPAFVKALAGAALIAAAGGTVAGVEHGSEPGRPADLRAVHAPAPVERPAVAPAASRSQPRPVWHKPAAAPPAPHTTVARPSVAARPRPAQAHAPAPVAAPAPAHGAQPAGILPVTLSDTPPPPPAGSPPPLGSADPGVVAPAPAAADPSSGSGGPTVGSGTGGEAGQPSGGGDPGVAEPSAGDAADGTPAAEPPSGSSGSEPGSVAEGQAPASGGGDNSAGQEQNGSSSGHADASGSAAGDSSRSDSGRG